MLSSFVYILVFLETLVKRSKIFSLLNTAPKMFINGMEEESETLIDDDADTCVNLTGSDGCKMDRVQNLFE